MKINNADQCSFDCGFYCKHLSGLTSEKIVLKHRCLILAYRDPSSMPSLFCMATWYVTRSKLCGS